MQLQTSLFISCALLLIGCQPATVTKDNIKIIKGDKHPILIDHGKFIVVVNGSKRIDEIEGYPDSGSGCSSHLFEEKNKFILIDCNGTIFYIDKRDGKIKKAGWGWMDELPPNYIGTFERQKGRDEYQFVKKSSIVKEDVYKAKDPND